MANRNPKSYGARGDGITDDTLGVQKAINAARPGDVVTGVGVFAVRGVEAKEKSRLSIALELKGVGIPAITNKVPAGPLVNLFLNTCSDVSVTGCRLTDANIGMYQCNDCRIERNIWNTVHLDKDRLAAIFAVGNTNCHYLGNVIQYGGEAIRGMWIGSYFTGWMDVDALIQGNTVRDMQATAIGYTGTGGRIIGNLVYDITPVGSGIVVASHGENQTKNISILGNTIRDVVWHGVQSDCVVPEYWTENVSVVGNTISKCGPGDGPNMAAVYAVRARGWTITGNVIDACDYGITAEQCERIHASANVMSGCKQEYAGYQAGEIIRG